MALRHLIIRAWGAWSHVWLHGRWVHAKLLLLLIVGSEIRVVSWLRQGIILVSRCQILLKSSTVGRKIWGLLTAKKILKRNRSHVLI